MNSKLPTGWAFDVFENHAKITCGIAATPEYVEADAGVPFLSARNVQNAKLNLEKYQYIKPELHKQLTKNTKPQIGDLLLTRVGAGIGEAAVVDINFEFSVYVSLTLIKCKKTLNVNYLKQVLNSPYYRYLATREQFAGGGVQNLNVQIVKKYKILIPPLDEQTYIANTLEKWDRAIEVTENLITAKQQQFEWLSTRLLLKNPNLKHWKTETLGSFIEERKDKSTLQDQYPCLTSSRRGMFLQEEYFSKQVASKDNTGYKIIQRNDFTFRSMSDDGLFVFNKQNIIDTGLISPAYAVFYPKKNMDGDFLYYFLNSPAFRRALACEVQGGTRTALKLNALKKLDVELPDFSEQKSIAHTLNTAQGEIKLLQALAEKYRTQKRGLMQKLLSGQWRLNDKKEAA